MKTKNVLVLGAGVSGLTTALMLLRAGHRVTIWTKDVAGATSSSAYAVWTPVRLDADPRVERWGFETLTVFNQLSQVSGSGVRLIPVWDLQVTQEEPWYAERCCGQLPYFRHARSGEITSPYQDAWILKRAPVIDPTVYLPWLHEQVSVAGGQFVQREVTNLADYPTTYDVVVNCTALGARQLCNDQELHPLMMQCVTIRSNGFGRVVFDQVGPNRQAHIVPHAGHIKLGADYEGEDSESMAVDAELIRRILERCSRIVPGGFKVDLGDVVSVVRCTRPRRALIRVEMGTLSDGRPVVHNYGHDGKAYIVSYGIAAEICRYLSALG